MVEPLKIVIPTAGWGTRMRPQTWSKPKPLVGVAGKAAIDHLLDSFAPIQPGMDVEYVIVVGSGLGEQQIPPYLQQHYPSYKIHYVLQQEMRGQSDALYLARQHLTGPVIVCFSDTLIKTDFSVIVNEKADCIAWVKPVPDPRRFGVAEADKSGRVTCLIEKPQSMENNLAVVGCYYFREGRQLVSAIQEQMKRGTTLRNEFYLVDAVNILIERGAFVRTQTVDIWLDTGTVEATLETNRFLLEHGCQTQNVNLEGVTILPPVFVHASAEIRDSIIGPHVSIGAGCKIDNSRLENTVLEEQAAVHNAVLKDSFLGRQARVQGGASKTPPMVLNISDNSTVVLE